MVDKACDLEAKILEAVAISPAGLICQIEALRDSGWDFGAVGYDFLIAGVRNIEAAMLSPSLSNAGGPIDSAPVKAGEKFGPCLLLTPAERNLPTLWTIGAWDDGGWYDLADGFYIQPTHWAPLPKAPADPAGFGEPGATIAMAS